MLITVGALGLLSSLDPLRPVVFLLLLRTDRARLNAIGFLVGWAIATAALFTVGFVAFDAGTLQFRGAGLSAQLTWRTRAP